MAGTETQRALRHAKADAAGGEGRWWEGRWANEEPQAAEALYKVDTAHSSRLIITALWLGLSRKPRKNQCNGSASTIEACQGAYEYSIAEPEPLVLKVESLITDEVALDEALDDAAQSTDEAISCFPIGQESLQVLQEAESKDYYAILGLPHDATMHEVKAAYRKGAQRYIYLRYHPDQAAAEGLSSEEAEACFNDLALAYEVLSNGQKRAAYDRRDDVEMPWSGQTGHARRSSCPGAFPGSFTDKPPMSPGHVTGSMSEQGKGRRIFRQTSTSLDWRQY